MLSKTNPIKLEHDFYVENMENSIGFIMLNEISIDLFSAENQNELKFSISPHLAPQVSLLPEQKPVKRLAPPIMYQIEPLPHKIDLKIETTSSQD